MCGICGIVKTDESSEIKAGDINSMVATLYRRGPDDQGIFLGRNVSLGIRRLSVIDLNGGHQPIHNEDKTLWIVFNGMIYNFLELRRHLEEKGHLFYTQTDTEVVVHLYEEYGSDCVLWLNGMFAFAIWETNKEKLFLARDRLGVKPLYYVDTENYFLFASEIKALLKFPQIKKEIDLSAFSRYLTFEYIPGPHSIFKGIKKLLPAHTLIYQDKNTIIQRYWNIAARRNTAENINIDGAVCQLSGLFEDAVKIRLISDVPKGVLLSGGIDSSLITAMSCKLGGNRIKTFSIGFDEPSFNESDFSGKVAEYFNTEHHVKTFTVKDLLSFLPAISESLDEPFADASIFPEFFLSKFAREYITVALCGDGGDELFAGYPTYIAHKIAAYLKPNSPLANQGISKLLEWMFPASSKYMSLDFKLKRFFSGLNNAPYIRHHLWMGSFSPLEKKQLLNPGITDYLKDTDIFEASRNYFNECAENDLTGRMQYLDINTYLVDDLLAKVDCASMSNALEVRSPFLDYRLVEFALNLPSKFKLNNLVTKYILKKYAQPILPKAIIHRQKKGFSIPLSSWIRDGLKSFVLDMLSEDKIKKEGFFQYPYIKKLLSDHFSCRVDNRKQIWTLLMFELWLEK